MTRERKTYSTIVADAHHLFRRGLATLIAAESDLELIGEAVTVAEALKRFEDAGRTAGPVADALVMDVGLIEDDENLKALRQLPESTSLLLLAPGESSNWLAMTVASGARGYMVKTSSPADLIAGIRHAAMGDNRENVGLSRQTPDLQALAKTGADYPRTTPLTPREQEVVTLLAQGRTVREVAAELSLSIKTVEAHKLNLMRKLDIHNRASLVDYAVRSGLISLAPVTA